MGRGKTVSDGEKEMIWQLILLGVKPVDIAEHFAERDRFISRGSIQNCKVELQKKLEREKSPVSIPSVVGRRTDESKRLAKTSIKAVTGKSPNTKISGAELSLHCKKYQISVNGTPIRFESTPKALFLKNDSIVIQYSSHQVTIKFKGKK